MPDADARALMDLLKLAEGTTVDVRCRACQQLFEVLELVDGSVHPVDRSHFGKSYALNFRRIHRDPARHFDRSKSLRVKLLCPCGQKSPSYTQPKLVLVYLDALAGKRDLIWPPG